jgi:hypothetical protein
MWFEKFVDGCVPLSYAKTRHNKAGFFDFYQREPGGDPIDTSSYKNSISVNVNSGY